MTIQEKLNLFHNNPVISWHEHVWFAPGTMELDRAGLEHSLEVMDAMGVDRMVVSCPVVDDVHCPPEKFIAANNVVAEAMALYPDRVFGMAFLNPGHHDAALSELDRCVHELGFCGLKLYHHYFMDDPVQYPLVEKCIDLDVPILMHSAKASDPITLALQPRCTNGVHIANIARRYPEGTFVMAHIGGGGDWQWSVRAIIDTPNVYTDMSGSIHDRPLLEEAVQLLGADRILFASDGTMDACVAKILGADISEEDKKTILAGAAFEKYLKRGGK